MNEDTRVIIAAVMEADMRISTSQKNEIVQILKNDGMQCSPRQNRLLKRQEVAEILGVSQRSVDLYAQRGALRRVRIPGQSRASGFLASDVDRCIGAVRAEG